MLNTISSFRIFSYNLRRIAKNDPKAPDGGTGSIHYVIGAKSGATWLQCSQKSFEDLRLGRKFSGKTLSDLSLAISSRSDNLFLAETFCLWKRVQAHCLFTKDSPGKLSVYQRVQANFLFFKESPIRIFVYQKRFQANFPYIKENASNLLGFRREFTQTFFLSKRVQENSLFIKESKQTFCCSK